MKSPTTHEVRGSVALLKSAVRASDANHDGKLDARELGEAIKQAGGGRAKPWRNILLGQISKFETVREINTELGRVQAKLIGADQNHNELISYGETVQMRQNSSPDAGYLASVLWNVAAGH